MECRIACRARPRCGRNVSLRPREPSWREHLCTDECDQRSAAGTGRNRGHVSNPGSMEPGVARDRSWHPGRHPSRELWFHVDVDRGFRGRRTSASGSTSSASASLASTSTVAALLAASTFHRCPRETPARSASSRWLIPLLAASSRIRSAMRSRSSSGFTAGTTERSAGQRMTQYGAAPCPRPTAPASDVGRGPRVLV